MTKKFIALLMSVVMLCSMCSVGVFADDGKKKTTAVEAYDVVTTGTAVVPDGSGTDAVIVIDTSGSMNNAGRDDAALNYAKSYAQKILKDDNSRVAIVAFGNSNKYDEAARVVIQLTNDYATISDALDGLAFDYDENMGRAFEYATEMLERYGVNKDKEIYLITDAFPVVGEKSALNRFAVWDEYGISSNILGRAEWVYNYVKTNVHSKNWYLKTQGIYTGMTDIDRLSFAKDFMSALANPPGNTSIDMDDDIVITLEPVTETTTEDEDRGSGSPSHKAQVDYTTEATTEAATTDDGHVEEPEDIYEYGALAGLPLIETYHINSKTAAVNAVTDMVSRIKAESSIDAEDPDVKDELANFADEAIGLSAQSTLSTGGIIDNDTISALADTAIDTKAAVEQAIIDGGMSIDRDLLTAVTLNSAGTVQLSADVKAIAVDNLHINVPGDGRMTIGSQFIEENASDEAIIVSFSIEGAEAEAEATEEAAEAEVADEATEATDEVAAVNGSVASFTINVLSPKITPICSMPLIPGATPDYQGVKGADGLTVSKANNSVRKIQFRPTSSGKYTVVNVDRLDFTDVNTLSVTQRDTLRKLYAHGLVEGMTETTFAPRTTLTRAEFTTLLLKTIGAYDPNYSGTSGFKDMSGVWSEPIVAKAKGLGIVAGYDSDNTFRPDNKLNNEQLYHMLGITYGKVNSRVSKVTSAQVDSEISKFTDASAIGQWARQNIAVSALSGFYTAGTSGSFNPRNEVTRFDAAQSINRLFERAPFEGRWN